MAILYGNISYSIITTYLITCRTVLTFVLCKNGCYQQLKCECDTANYFYYHSIYYFINFFILNLFVFQIVNDYIEVC